jgi:inorganic phosphate transporter, PiT family
MSVEMILFILVLVAGFYMAWNIGANDVANAMGTSVGSGALSLKQAVMIAAILEFSGAFFFGSHVSETVQNGIVDSSFFNQNPRLLVYGMLASLMASGVWLQIASYYGWPVSTTHSIVGAIVGFAAVVGGAEAVYWENVSFIVSSWIISPLLGGVLSFGIFTILRKKIFYSDNPVEQAKKITPPLIFVITSVLSFIIIYKVIANLQIYLAFFEVFLLSTLFALVAGAITKYCVQKIKIIPRLKTHQQYSPEVVVSLEKARKHLLRVQAATSGEVEYHSQMVLEEMDSLSHSLSKEKEPEEIHAEYAVVEKIFGYLQIISACLMAFAHGANDVANAIGPLSASIGILTTGAISQDSTVPTWALALGGTGIVIGLATWGWRVILTIGKKITELTPTRGFAAEFGCAITVVIASRLGLPISTTHTLVGSVVGVGLARGIEALNLSTTRDIIVSWVVTVPAGAILSIGFFFGLKAIFG